MKPKVSIIVPVYNTQKQYLDRCLESLRGQSYPCYELIIVDDGSAEETASVLNEWAALDDRIKLFHRSNGGVSSARNFGIHTASGKYIMFVDSDDVVTTDWLNWAVEVAEKHSADIVFGEVKGISFASEIAHFDQAITGKCRVIAENQIWKIRCGQLIQKMKDNEPMFEVGYFGNWGKLFKADLLNNLQFDEECYYGEDQLFNHQALCKARSAVWSSDISYFLFLDRDGSATNRYDPKRMEAVKRYLKKSECLFEDDEWVKQAFYLHTMKLSENEIFHILKSQKKKLWNTFRLNALLKSTLKDAIFSNAIAKSDIRLLKYSSLWVRMFLIKKQWTILLVLWDVMAMARRERKYLPNAKKGDKLRA